MNADTSVEIIAEIAQAHDGSLGIAHSYIDAIAETGVDTVKFQMHIAHAESSSFEQFRVNFSYEDKSRYDYWDRMGFEFEHWVGLKKHCEDKGLNFLCSPFSMKAVEWMENLEVDRYKIASGEVNNLLMLEAIAKTGKKILLSSGMSDYSELLNASSFIANHGGNLDAVFQCTTAYPTPPDKYGLNVIPELKTHFNAKVGLSDHSGEIYAPLAATVLGAQLLEMHVVFDKKMFGPDASSSLTINDFKQLVDGVRKIEIALNSPVEKNTTDQFKEMKLLFGKSLSMKRSIKAGETLKFEDLETRKPGNMGIKASDYSNVIGKVIQKDLLEGDFINYQDLSQ
ncbi:MAG: N-acetylneuraminate synthase family protein [Bacteroidia bacterium]|nr:N-acetylneuraminate synthase family protein [Bacteroidia bacterium]